VAGPRPFTNTSESADTPEFAKLIGGTVYFTGSDAAHGQELWTSSGTIAGTVRGSDLNGGPAPSLAMAIGLVNGRLVVIGDDGLQEFEVFTQR
jgi:ELWxxDGT repeat protein